MVERNKNQSENRLPLKIPRGKLLKKKLKPIEIICIEY